MEAVYRNSINQDGDSSNGFTMHSNVICDELLADLTSAEFKVLYYIIRRTHGFQKSTDAISISQMVNGITKKDGTVFDRGTGLSEKTVLRAIGGKDKGLVGKGVILKTTGTEVHGGASTNLYTMTIPKPREKSNEGGSPQNAGRVPAKCRTQKKANKDKAFVSDSNSIKGIPSRVGNLFPDGQGEDLEGQDEPQPGAAASPATTSPAGAGSRSGTTAEEVVRAVMRNVSPVGAAFLREDKRVYWLGASFKRILRDSEATPDELDFVVGDVCDAADDDERYVDPERSLAKLRKLHGHEDEEDTGPGMWFAAVGDDLLSLNRDESGVETYSDLKGNVVPGPDENRARPMSVGERRRRDGYDWLFDK